MRSSRRHLLSFLFAAVIRWSEACQDEASLLLPTSSSTTTGSILLSTNTTTIASVCGQQPPVRGSYFRVQGTGRVLEVKACGEAIKNDNVDLSVLDACEAETCVARGVPDDDDDTCRRVAWQSQPSTEYYLWVHYYTSQDNSTTTIPTISLDLTLQELNAPTNDVCSAATPLSVTEDGATGSTRNATLERATDDLSCRIRYESAGVWYTVVGTGSVLRASTCHAETDFDSALSVFPASADGKACTEALERCAGGNQDNFDCGFVDGATLTWPSAPDELYYVLLHGNRPEDVGNYRLTLEELETAPNNHCETAIGPLPTDGTLTTGSTSRATADTDLNALCAGSNFSPGVWFTVLGTGKTLTVSTCSPETKFDTRVSVLTVPADIDDCTEGAFECVGGHDDDIECDDNIQSSTFSWESEKDLVYHILVHGALESSVGNYGLTVTEESSAMGWFAVGVSATLASSLVFILV